jgi:tetratricopeptide (TPR) repeat protein
LASRRALLEDEHKVQQLRSTLGRVVDRLRANKRFRLLVGLQILLILLFLVPAATYLFVSVFPSTQALQAFFELPIIFSILKGLTMLGVLLLVARLFFFYRFLPVLKRLQGGQGLAGYLLGGIVAHGALLLGLIALLLAFQGRPTQELLDLLNLAQWAEFLTAVLSVALFVLGVGLLIFSGLGVLAVPAEVLFGIKVAELLLDIYTIADLVIESQHDGLYALERLELSLAIYSLLLFPLAIPGAIPMPAVARWVLEGTDAVLGGEQVWVEFQGPRETDWSLPNRTCTLFNHIRQGDRALRNHQPGQALRSYGEARHLTAQVRTTPLTRGVIMTRIGDTLRSQGDDHGALVAYQDALDQMPSAGVLPEYQANLHVRIGDLHVREEDYPAAIQSYQSALELYQAAGADAMQVSEAMLKLGESWLHAGDTDRAVQFLRESLELMTRAGKASRERAALFERLGDGFLATSDPEQAAQCFQLGIEDYQALGSPLAEGLLGRLDALQ